MGPLLKILLIAVLGFTGLLFMAGQTGNKNVTANDFVPENATVPANTTRDIWDALTRFPVSDFLDMIFAGTAGVINWGANLFNVFVGVVVHVFRPEAAIPSWIGWLGILAIAGAVLWSQGSNVLGFGYTLLMYITIVLLLMVLLGMALTIMGAV